jgi:hypothetical protein
MVDASTQSTFTAAYVQVIIVVLDLANMNGFLINEQFFFGRKKAMLETTGYHQILRSMHLQDQQVRLLQQHPLVITWCKTSHWRKISPTKPHHLQSLYSTMITS